MFGVKYKKLFNQGEANLMPTAYVGIYKGTFILQRAQRLDQKAGDLNSPD